MSKRLITPAERVAELVAEHGSLRKAASVLSVDFAKLWKIGKGRTSPRAAMLRKLGLNPSKALFERLT